MKKIKFTVLYAIATFTILGLNITTFAKSLNDKGESAELYPRNIYQVINYGEGNESFAEDILGFKIPNDKLPRVKLPFGYKVHEVIVPWSVRGEMIQIIGFADPHLVEEKIGLAKLDLKPVLVNGKAVVALYLLNYADSGSGPYEESLITYLAQSNRIASNEYENIDKILALKSKKNSPITNFVDHLSLGGDDRDFMSYQIAIWAGRVAISYPKFYGRTFLEIKPGRVKASISQPEVKYFRSRSLDAGKAGSIELNFNLQNDLIGESKYESEVSYDYHVAKVGSSGRCIMGNHLYAEVAELTGDSSKLSFSISGSSESALNLAGVGFIPQRVFHGKNLRIYMFRDKSRPNNCGEGYNSYDYKLFYPDHLTPQ